MDNKLLKNSYDYIHTLAAEDVIIEINPTRGDHAQIDYNPKDVEVQCIDGILAIKGKEHVKNRNTIILRKSGVFGSSISIFSSSKSVIIENGTVVSDGGEIKKESAIKPVKVLLPHNAKIMLRGSLDAKMGDFSNSNVEINLSGNGQVLASAVKSTNINISGSGDVEIEKIINGNVNVTVSGSGDVEILSGQIQSLNARVVGSGDVEINANVTKADLSVIGSGDIRIDKCEQEPSISVVGSGDIRVNGKKYPKKKRAGSAMNM